MADDFPPSIRLMNFVSQEQLDEAKRTRGERVDDGTAQRDRPLYEILKENKDKRDAEFNERFKHRPPKALDEEETEFLDKLEMSKKEYEQQMAGEEAQQLRRFQVAVAAQSMIVHEHMEQPRVPFVQEQRSRGRKSPAAHPLGMIIKVKPQAKKAKVDPSSSEKLSSGAVEVLASKVAHSRNLAKATSDGDGEIPLRPLGSLDSNCEECSGAAVTGLVSYSDESEEGGEDDD
ncbi:hypothetical protein Nepgr_027569 [Nepenthes gracilis]|uniref:FAM192A/Fyv6 N-terminal domain-containing protein n=1 Tax=Nepenthes gracilis TaxID=150966 RepID=A0AAD3Y3N9_NEPGR|nr:hypothetical protein Nepgr_027569 [Nepenthes gracilis]